MRISSSGLLAPSRLRHQSWWFFHAVRAGPCAGAEGCQASGLRSLQLGFLPDLQFLRCDRGSVHSAFGTSVGPVPDFDNEPHEMNNVKDCAA